MRDPRGLAHRAVPDGSHLMEHYDRSIASAHEPDKAPFHDGMVREVDGLTAVDSILKHEDGATMYRDVTEQGHGPDPVPVMVGYYWRDAATLEDDAWEWHGFMV